MYFLDGQRLRLLKQSNKQDSFKPDTHSKQGLQVSGCPVNLDC